MSESDSVNVTIHLRFRSDGAIAPAITVRDVHDWLRDDADIEGFARAHNAWARVMISSGRTSEIIDFDGSGADEKTVIRKRPLRS